MLAALIERRTFALPQSEDSLILVQRERLAHLQLTVIGITTMTFISAILLSQQRIALDIPERDCARSGINVNGDAIAAHPGAITTDLRLLRRHNHRIGFLLWHTFFACRIFHYTHYRRRIKYHFLANVAVCGFHHHSVLGLDDILRPNTGSHHHSEQRQ